MAVERLVSPLPDPTLEDRNWSLRPKRMGEYVGQPELLERLRITIHAVRQRKEPMEHVLLHGPPGLGKTTLAHVIAQEMGTAVHITSGPALTKPSDLVGTLTRLGHADVLFIDEIHRLPVTVEEFVYPAMEDFRVDIKTESGLSAQTIQLHLKPFTLIGATTRAGLVSGPMRSRFGITHSLRFYTAEELLEILRRSCSLLAVESADDALTEVARRSRGTPRIANRLLRRVRDFAQVKAAGRLDRAVVTDALDLEGVDPNGLDELDRAYLRAIATTYQGGPVGLEALAATLNQDAGTLEDMVEPFLLQIGFLARSRRGRILTAAAARHIGLPHAAPDDTRRLEAARDDDALF